MFNIEKSTTSMIVLRMDPMHMSVPDNAQSADLCESAV